MGPSSLELYSDDFCFFNKLNQKSRSREKFGERLVLKSSKSWPAGEGGGRERSMMIMTIGTTRQIQKYKKYNYTITNTIRNYKYNTNGRQEECLLMAD